MYSINILINFIYNHEILIYLILFLSSYFETLIVVSFFIYGEIFFLIGGILAGMNLLNLYLVILILYLGGILGDYSSFLIGKKFGKEIFLKLSKYKILKKKFNLNNYEKGEIFFKKYGEKSIFLSRFLNSISWITPILSGIFKLNTKNFLKYDIPAVILWVGQFIIIGYFFGKNYNLIINYVKTYFFIILFFIIMAYYFYINFKKKIKEIKNFENKSKKTILKYLSKNFIKSLIMFLLIYLIILILIFFIFNSQTEISKFKQIKNTSLNSLIEKENLNLYYNNKNQDFPIQAINIILITNKNISNLFERCNWIKNLNFKKNKINLKTFYYLSKNKTLPISELYFKNKTEDYSFQEKSNYSSIRTHIRIYNYGILNNKKIYFLSISEDKGFTINKYYNFIIPLHKINPNIDLSRNKFLKNFKKCQKLKFNYSYIKSNSIISKPKNNFKEDSDINYYSDKKVLIINFNK